MNNKGFTGLEIGGIVALGFLVVSVVLPIFGVNIMPGANGKTSTQSKIQTTRMVPYVNPNTGENVKVLNKDGSTTLLMQQDSSNQTLDETVIPKAPLVERVVLWFVRLGFLGFALALLFPTVAVTVWMWIRNRWKKLKEESASRKMEHDVLEEETKTIIRSVDEAFATIPLTIAGENLPGEVDRVALAKRIQDGMLTVLGDNYDQSTKDLVKALRDA